MLVWLVQDSGHEDDTMVGGGEVLDAQEPMRHLLVEVEGVVAMGVEGLGVGAGNLEGVEVGGMEGVDEGMGVVRGMGDEVGAQWGVDTVGGMVVVGGGARAGISYIYKL